VAFDKLLGLVASERIEGTCKDDRQPIECVPARRVGGLWVDVFEERVECRPVALALEESPYLAGHPRADIRDGLEVGLACRPDALERTELAGERAGGRRPDLGDTERSQKVRERWRPRRLDFRDEIPGALLAPPLQGRQVLD